MPAFPMAIFIGSMGVQAGKADDQHSKKILTSI
jgi:hypothetical protein